MAYMPRLKTALTGARRCTTWAASRPPRDTAMAWPAGSRAMLATTMPSYRFSASRAPRWGSRSPAISEAAVSTSRAASRGHTDRSQVPGSSTTTATPARKPAVTTSPMNQRSRGGSPLKVIPPFRSSSRGPGRGARSRPARAGRRSGPGGCSLSSGSGGHRFRLAQLRAAGAAVGVGGDQPAAAQVPAVQRRDAQLRAVQSTAAQLLAAQDRAAQASSAQLRAARLLAARSSAPQASSAQLRAAQLRATQSTVPPSPPSPVPPSPPPSRVAARTSPHDHWRTAQAAGASPAADHCLAAQTRASHCWAAQLLADQPSTAHRPLSQGRAVQASVSPAPAVGPGSPSAGAQRSPSAPPDRQPSPSSGSDGTGGGAPGRPTARSGNRSPLATRSGTSPRAAARSSAPAPDPVAGPSGPAVPVRAALTRSGSHPG